MALAILRALRPKQWTKNALLFAALIFAERYTDLDAVRHVLIGFALFCMISSSGYLVNDLRDVEADRLHPQKKHRPIAAGTVSVPMAWLLAALLMVVGIGGAFQLNTGFGLTAASYLVVTLTYSAFFKHTVVLDVMLIATGFVLRAVAGAEAIPVVSSPWFLTCTAFGALFIGFSKRLAEIRALGDAAEPTPYVTAGFYYFDPEIFSIIKTARRNRLQALRQFLGLLLEKGYPVYGVPVSKTIDVDCPEDLRKAKDYLKEKNSEARSQESKKFECKRKLIRYRA